MTDYMKQYRIYKANRSNSGSALSVDYNKDKSSIFLEFAKQKEERKFDWDNKISIKLSIIEIAKINTFYNNKTAEIKLFHDPSKGQYNSSFRNAILNITRSSSSYYFKLNQQESDGSLKSISVNLNEEEMYILKMLFDKIIQQSYL